MCINFSGSLLSNVLLSISSILFAFPTILSTSSLHFRSLPTITLKICFLNVILIHTSAVHQTFFEFDLSKCIYLRVYRLSIIPLFLYPYIESFCYLLIFISTFMNVMILRLFLLINIYSQNMDKTLIFK